MAILESLFEDIPQQFKGKKNIEVLVRAMAKQLQELNDVIEDINSRTDITTAEGINLDRVGDIVCLTRKEAKEILHKPTEIAIDDDVYRKTLQYQALKNTSDCTYEDIMDSLSIIWDTEDVTYKEEIEKPARVSLELPTVDIDGIDPLIGKTLALKSAGVALIYTVGYLFSIYIKETITVPGMMMRMRFPALWMLFFDGTWDLDGYWHFDGSKYRIPMGLKLGAYSIKADLNKEDYSLGTKDLWKLDGKYLINGDRKFNSGDLIYENL